MPPELGISCWAWAFAPEQPSEKPEHEIWLHESTEACAEIMVRVLWPASIDITGDGEGQAAYCLPTDIEANGAVFKEADPMLAFRVAVLRALTTLNAPDGARRE